MHARRERRIDRTFRLRCRVCGSETLPVLGGDMLDAAKAGGPLEKRCRVKCHATTRHEVVAP